MADGAGRTLGIFGADAPVDPGKLAPFFSTRDFKRDTGVAQNSPPEDLI